MSTPFRTPMPSRIPRENSRAAIPMCVSASNKPAMSTLRIRRRLRSSRWKPSAFKPSPAKSSRFSARTPAANPRCSS